MPRVRKFPIACPLRTIHVGADGGKRRTGLRVRLLFVYEAVIGGCLRPLAGRMKLVDLTGVEPVRGVWFVGPCREQPCQALEMTAGTFGSPFAFRRRLLLSRRSTREAWKSSSPIF
jgi:hypothetical protein